MGSAEEPAREESFGNGSVPPSGSQKNGTRNKTENLTVKLKFMAAICKMVLFLLWFCFSYSHT